MAEAKYKRVLLKISGEALAGDAKIGINDEVLKEISKNKLVIMVTHNPDLAETYATRTICLLDGLITSDSLPLTDE